jgi:hypothetical protein
VIGARPKHRGFYTEKPQRNYRNPFCSNFDKEKMFEDFDKMEVDGESRNATLSKSKTMSICSQNSQKANPFSPFAKKTSFYDNKTEPIKKAKTTFFKEPSKCIKDGCINEREVGRNIFDKRENAKLEVS